MTKRFASKIAYTIAIAFVFSSLLSANVSAAGIKTFVAATSRSSEPTAAEINTMAANYDVADGSYYWFRNSVNALHAVNPNFRQHVYFNMRGIDITTSVFAEANPSEDWFMHSVARSDPAYGPQTRLKENGYQTLTQMNPRSPGWQAWAANKIKSWVDAYGYDGVFLDNGMFRAMGSSYYYPALDAIDPDTGAAYTDAATANDTKLFLTALKNIVNLPICANSLDRGHDYYSSDGATYINTTDAKEFMAEGFGHPGAYAPTAFPSETYWKQDVDMLVDAESKGKSIWAYNHAGRNSTAAQAEQIDLYGLATFLLGAGDNSYYGFNDGNTSFYWKAYWDTDIGSSLGQYYVSGSVYQRDFTKGKVLVNPTDSGQTYIAPLGNLYRTLDGQMVTSISLAPKTGTILTKIAGAAAPTVSFGLPTDGATVSGKVTLSANASDDLGVTKVEFYVDGELDSTDTAAPYEATWHTTYYTKGNHTITAKAYDASGNIGTATVIVSVNSQVTTLPGNSDVLVKFKTGTSQTAIDAIIQRFGLTTKKTLLTGWYRFTVPVGTSVAHMASLLLNQPEVEYAEINSKRDSYGDEEIASMLEGEEALTSDDQMLVLDLDLAGLSAVIPLAQNNVSVLDGNLTSVAGAQTITKSAADMRGDKLQSAGIITITTYGLSTVLSLFALACLSLVRRILIA